MNISRTWTVEVTPEDAGETWPDYDILYYSLATIRPERIVVIFKIDGSPLAAPKMRGVSITGRKVLKSGNLGSTEMSDYFYSDSKCIPAWVTRAVDLARREIGVF